MNNEVLQGQQDLFLLVTVRVRIYDFLKKGEVRPFLKNHKCGHEGLGHGGYHRLDKGRQGGTSDEEERVKTSPARY